MSLANVSPPASPVAHHSLNLHFTTAPYCMSKSHAASGFHIFAVLIIETFLIKLYKYEQGECSRVHGHVMYAE